MKEMKALTKFVLGLSFLLGSSVDAVAQLTPGEVSGQEVDQDVLNTITTAVPFLMISPDSRSGALGDAGVALSPDVNSLHWNPAKMAFIEDDVEYGLGYSPWLRALVDDMNLAYLSTVQRIDKRSAWGAALRYFNLGSITFTDEYGSNIVDFQPTELSLDIGYSQKLGPRFSAGITGRYINSNLTGGINILGATTTPGRSVAVDVGLFYTNPRAKIGGLDAEFNWGMNISNIGAKISYSESAERDFLPTNLRTGAALQLKIDDYNSLTFTADFNKLLVPTPPITDPQTGEIISGYDPNVGVAQGMIQSFYDAPGNLIYAADSTRSIESGSKLREELREFNIGGGVEYLFNDVFAFRTGFFNEPWSKGNRQFISMGAGIKYTAFTVDFSYLLATRQTSPLANTLRFTLRLRFSDVAQTTTIDE